MEIIRVTETTQALAAAPVTATDQALDQGQVQATAIQVTEIPTPVTVAAKVIVADMVATTEDTQVVALNTETTTAAHHHRLRRHRLPLDDHLVPVVARATDL